MPEVLRYPAASRIAHAALLTAALLGLAICAWSAEIVGRIDLESKDPFGNPAGAAPAGGVSVAALPLDHQPLPQRSPDVYQVVIRGKHFDPVFLTVQRGDKVRFVNEDGVVHEVFSLSTARPFELHIPASRNSPPASAPEVEFVETGTWHVFCRINRSMYARIDVVDTPYVRMLPEGGNFRFSSLPPGRWRLRIAALGAETQSLETTAITTPPPLEVHLAVRNARSDAAGEPRALYTPSAIERLYPRP